ADDETAGANRVVIPGDDVVSIVGVAVGVHEREHGHLEPTSLANRELLLAQIEDEHGVRKPLHVHYSAQVGLELLELALHRHALLRRQELELPFVTKPAQLVQALE